MKNKIHTTNYYNTFITVADDCLRLTGIIPPQKTDHKTIARLQYDILIHNPYKYSSDEVLFRIFAERNKIPKPAVNAARKEFFSKGQACFRASPLPKQFGWGIHSDETGKIAIYGVETETYQKLINERSINKVKAMRNSRK